MEKLKTKVSDMAEEKLRVSDVRQRLYITKTRWGVYEVLNEYQYERKLIYGYMLPNGGNMKSWLCSHFQFTIAV